MKPQDKTTVITVVYSHSTVYSPLHIYMYYSTNLSLKCLIKKLLLKGIRVLIYREINLFEGCFWLLCVRLFVRGSSIPTTSLGIGLSVIVIGLRSLILSISFGFRLSTGFRLVSGLGISLGIVWLCLSSFPIRLSSLHHQPKVNKMRHTIVVVVVTTTNILRRHSFFIG